MGVMRNNKIVVVKNLRVLAQLMCFVLMLAFVQASFVLPKNTSYSHSQSIRPPIEQNLANSLKINDDNDFVISRESLATKSYQVDDNSGYNVPSVVTSHPLGTNWAELSLVVNGGEINKGSQVNGENAYGYVMDGGFDDGEDGKMASVEIALRYRHNTTSNINGTKWQISDDSWKKGINGISGVGVVHTGALLVSKSTTGEKGSYQWDNPYNNGVTTSYHTVDFVEHYKPSMYSGDNFLTIYTPSGQDLVKGIFVKVMFAYELKYSTSGGFLGLGTEWHYANVVEESTFYIANGAANVYYQNLVFSESNDNEISEEESQRTEMISNFGTILSGHATNEGFRVNANGNSSYKIEYIKDKSTNYKLAQDGELFTTPGRYDFRVTPKVGKSQTTTIYINERGIRQAVDRYFGDGFITKDSHRVFMDVPIPVYVKDETRYNISPISDLYPALVGIIKRVSGQEIVKIDPDDPNYDPDGDDDQYITVNTYDIVRQLSAEESRQGWSGIFDTSGQYEVEFANNPNYFDGSISGDLYRFVFRFLVVDDANAPIINQNLLDNNLDFFGYGAGYYAVPLSTQGKGKAVFAYPNFAEAHNFAYEYMRSLVVKDGDKYIFDGVTYPSQLQVLEVVTKAAEKIVEKRYFDPSNRDSYLTVQNAIESILQQNISKDVIVLGDMYSAYNMKKGESSLNDRVRYYLDEYGNTNYTKEPVRLIKVSNFESNSIKLIEEKTGFSTNIDYNAPVESVLRGKNAPSGRYKIVESNIYGDTNTYYGVYIKAGDNQTSLQIDVTLNGIQAKHNLGQQDNLTRMSANNFVLRSATNELDPYGIVKVEKVGESTQIYELSEVKDITVDQEGSYKVSIVDRQGNSAEFFIDIYTSKKLYTLTLDNNGEITQEIVSSGQKINLPTVNSPNPNLEFVGWSDGSNLYKDRLVYNYSSDIRLTAIFNHHQTIVEIYDGNRLSTHTVKPGDKIVLPERDKSDLFLYGFAYTQQDGAIRFYRGQITTVPNVSHMRLDAMWVDYSQSFTTENIQQSGMTFVGWLYEKDGLSGTILDTDQVQDGMQVYALWKSNPTTNRSGGIAGFLTNLFGGGTTNNLLVVLTTFLATVLVGLFAKKLLRAKISLAQSKLYLLSNKILLKQLSYCNIATSNAKQGNRCVAVPKTQIVSNSAYAMQTPQLALSTINSVGASFVNPQNSARTYASIKAENYGITSTKSKTKIQKQKRHSISNHSATKKAIIAISITMCLILAITALSRLILPLKQSLDLDIQLANFKQQQEQQYDNSNNLNIVTNEKIDEIQNAYADDGVEMTDEEAFLYAKIIADLVSLEYDVFPANAITFDKTIIKGIGYTTYSDVHEREIDGKLFFNAGFMPLLGEKSLNSTDVSNGVELSILGNTIDISTNQYGFFIGYEQELTGHYVSLGQYIVYQSNNFSLLVISNENNIDVYDLTLGELYDYDRNLVLYDPNLGNNNTFNPDAFSGVQGVDYDYAFQISQDIILQQDENYLTVDMLQAVYIAPEAINEWLVNNQEESYLGIPTDVLQGIEAQLSNTVFYYIDGDGELQFAAIPPDPEPNVWKTIFAWSQIALGGLLIITGVGAGIGAMMMIGGIIGLISDELSTILGGLGSIGNGLKCLLVGIQLFSLGPIGWIAGTVVVVTGLATIAIGINDILSVLTGKNFIQELTGLDDQAYFWLSLGLNIASTIFAIAGSNALKDCFIAGTAVLTVVLNGTIQKKAIEDVIVGDRVVSYNESTGKNEVKSVLQIFNSQHKELVNIQTNNGETISSVEHPYYVNRNNTWSWISAKNLRVGDILVAVNGQKVIVEQVQHEILEQPQTLYNFEVEGNHNYYVAESVKLSTNKFVLAHNKCNTNMNFETREDALKYGQEFLDDGYKEVANNRWVSSDGFRQMRYDLSHGPAHYNLETFKYSYWDGGRNKIISNIHLWFK